MFYTGQSKIAKGLNTPQNADSPVRGYDKRVKIGGSGQRFLTPRGWIARRILRCPWQPVALRASAIRRATYQEGEHVGFCPRVGVPRLRVQCSPNPHPPVPRRSAADPVAQQFGARLREARKQRDETLEQVAHRIPRMDAKYLGEIERGWHAPSISTAKRIADALEVDLAELVRAL